MPVDERPLFFIHVMKTGGTTLWMDLVAHFGQEHVYPVAGGDDAVADYLDAARLLALPAEQRDAIRVFGGHHPYVITELLGVELVRLTILREPVARTISYLKHAQRHTPRLLGWPLEEIYADGFAFPFWIANHQTKAFSLRADDLDLVSTPTSVMTPLEVDDERLEQAKANLATVDVVGFQERYPEFRDEVAERFGLPQDRVPPQRVSEEVEVSAGLVERIIEDNRYDVALYEWALAHAGSRARS